MAESSEETAQYLEKFRLINEPTNHWNARKTFLLRNWDDYPEMQLISLSMVWSNMQFDGCKYSPELMDRVRDMAAGIPNHQTQSLSSVKSGKRCPQPNTVNETTSIKQEQDSDEQYTKYPAKRLCTSEENAHAVCESKPNVTESENVYYTPASSKRGKDISGNEILINLASSLVTISPYNPSSGDATKTDSCFKLREVYRKFRATGKCKTGGNSDVLKFWNLLNSPAVPNKVEYKDISDKASRPHAPQWKAYFIICETLCATHVASSKKAAKLGVVAAVVDFWKGYEVVMLQKSLASEKNELGFVHELVYVNESQDKILDVGEISCLETESSDCSAEDSTETPTESHKVLTAESILAALPSQFASHELNCIISAAPKLPNFVLFESLEENVKFGYANPVGKLVNSASMCRVPIEFAMETFKLKRVRRGVVCKVSICSCDIATGLALGTREAKHLAAHNAIQALKMTNLTLRKSTTVNGQAVSRNQLADGSAKEEAISESNVGHKLLKMMGWKGEGGLGKKGEGIEKPVEATGSSSKSKEGLGFDLLQLKDPTTRRLDERKVLQFLQDYARSNREDELVFTSELSQDERKKLHSMSVKFGLKSRSRGKGDTRFLTIGRKWDVSKLVQAVAEKGGSMGNYELVGPSL